MHIPFDYSIARADIFIFFNYKDRELFDFVLSVEDGRYVANILKEAGMYIVALIFVFLLWYETRNRFYLILFIWWAYNVLGYLLAYGQSTSVIGLPLLFILLFIHYAKVRKNT